MKKVLTSKKSLIFSMLFFAVTITTALATPTQDPGHCRCQDFSFFGWTIGHHCNRYCADHGWGWGSA